jgi:CO dehydrogenase/acetyl-CoA synthase beta subunit
MSAFDDSIRELGICVDSLRERAASAVKELSCPGAPEALLEGLPIRVGPDANPGVLLRSDTFVELGNPAAGSCAAVLWTDDTSLVVDGRITLVGPDIPDADEPSLPFAQLLLVAGPELCEEDHEEIVSVQYVGDRVEGYMVRSTSEYLWARVSNEAAAKGFGFESLGTILLHFTKTALPKASAAEVVFVTTSKDDVEQFAAVADRAKAIGSEILSELWKARGFDLDCNFDCASCSDEAVCDDIRDVIVATKKKAGVGA